MEKLGSRLNRLHSDLTGNTYGRWTVLGFDDNSPMGRYKWICRCECGTEKSVDRSSLKRGKSVSCGCFRGEIVSKLKMPNIIGKRYGKLKVVEWKESKEDRNIWICTCDCGSIVEKPTSYLKETSSCGCWNPNKTHGMSGTRIYNIWEGMKRRCKGTSKFAKEYYLDKGIEYDPRWEKFENFYEDMKTGYSGDLTLDRIDPNGDYCKENCRWVDRSVQAFNTIRQKNNISGRTGVILESRSGKWVARIEYKCKVKHLGTFEEFSDAVRAREEAEILYFGQIKE